MKKTLQQYTCNLQESIRRYGNLSIALVFALSGLMPILLTGQAHAAQLTSRSVTITSSQPAATGTGYTFQFTTPTGGATIQSIAFSFCTTALAGCTLPANMLVDRGTTTLSATQTGFAGAAFAEYTGADAGGCTTADGGAAATQYCISRTEAGNESAGVKNITINGITNPTIASGNNTSVYVRIFVYTDDSFATLQHEGAVAASIVNQLTVTGRVQERLVFCVFALDDTAGSSATVGAAATNMPTDCAANEANASTAVDMGIVDHLTIAKSPVDLSLPSSIGNDRFGAAMINTNASNGVSLTYYASAAATGTNELRAFRVPGATCDVSGTNVTDQCFVSADDTAGELFSAGTERFGVQIACVVNSTALAIGTTSNLGKNGAGAYTAGDGTGGSFNTVYDAGRTNLDDDVNRDCENDAGGTLLTEEFGWRDSGTAQALISSAAVVDDEMVKLRYAATANATTPTGTYTVASTYIATPSY